MDAYHFLRFQNTLLYPKENPGFMAEFYLYLRKMTKNKYWEGLKCHTLAGFPGFLDKYPPLSN